MQNYVSIKRKRQPPYGSCNFNFANDNACPTEINAMQSCHWQDSSVHFLQTGIGGMSTESSRP
jgi:hypothetical protein